MDKEWLEYWQKVEDLEVDEKEQLEKDKNNTDKSLEEAKDLYKSVLEDSN